VSKPLADVPEPGNAPEGVLTPPDNTPSTTGTQETTQ